MHLSQVILVPWKACLLKGQNSAYLSAHVSVGRGPSNRAIQRKAAQEHALGLLGKCLSCSDSEELEMSHGKELWEKQNRSQRDT